MNVAVPPDSELRPLQHSPRFGQLASSQTVLRSWSRKVCLMPVNSRPEGGRIFSQSGFRRRLIGWVLGSGGQKDRVFRDGGRSWDVLVTGDGRRGPLGR